MWKKKTFGNQGGVIIEQGPNGWAIIGFGGLIGLALCIIGLALFSLVTWAGWALIIYSGGQSLACICYGVARIVEARGRAQYMIGAAARADMKALGWGCDGEV